MAIARNIALIFLSLDVLIVALFPLALLVALSYGIHRLRPLVKVGLQQALGYAEKARVAVEKISLKIVAPFIWLYSKYQLVETITHHLIPRRSI
ncbi:MAG: hypothetical protein U9Q70_06965 [Chloroflexota bacterium]|nr:hypothetical protein [Chloroflexota bacterium]